MKKLLLLLTVLCSAFMAQAQAQVLTVSGTVTDPAGAGVPNQIVLLMDSTAGIFAATHTDNNGAYFWVDSVFGSTQGVLNIAVLDCNGPQTVSLPYSPASLILTANFTNFCVGSGGGGGGSVCNFATFTQTTDPTFCNGNDGTASVSVLSGGTAPYSYAWTNGQTTSTIIGLQTGTYDVTITDATGCSEIHTVFIGDGCGGWGGCGFIPNITSSDPTFCNGNDGTITVLVSGGSAPYTYTWDNGQTTATATGLQMGVYTVIVTDAVGCSETYSFYIGDGCSGWGLPCNLNATLSTVLPSSTTANDGSITVLINNPSPTLMFSIDWGMTWQTSNTFNNLPENFYDIIIVDTTSNCSDYLFVQLGNNFPCGVQFGYVENGLTFDFTSFVSTGGANCYNWDFGDGNTSTAANPTHTFAAAGMYNVTLTICDSLCSASYTETIYVGMNPQRPSLIGFIFKDTLIGTPADAIVYLIQHDSINGTLTLIDSTMTQSGTGFFFFDSLATGNYLVKGALLPNDPDYANYLPTYFVNALSWTNAFYVDVQSNFPAFAYVQLVQGNNTSGAGFIGGLIVNGAGRPFNGVVTLVEDVTNMDPIAGASVLLLDGNGNPITHTTTDEDGAYQFAGVGMGDYKVHVEMLGKIIYEAALTVDAAHLDHTNVHFTVHSSMVTLTGTESVQFIDGVNVFPNPVTDVANVQVEIKESADVTVVLTNLVGQQVATQNQRLNAGQNNFNVEMNNLPSGLYFLTFRSGSEVVTYKVQKQ